LKKKIKNHSTQKRGTQIVRGSKLKIYNGME